MNRISRIVAKNILLDPSLNLWNEEESRIIEELLASISNASTHEDVIDRSLAVKTFKYTDKLSTNASYVACRMLNRIPPAIFGIVAGNPHMHLKPLEVEQLRALDGDPVWIYNSTAGASFWMLAYSDVCSNRVGHLDTCTYGKSWVAYGLTRTY